MFMSDKETLIAPKSKETEVVSKVLFSDVLLQNLDLCVDLFQVARVLKTEERLGHSTTLRLFRAIIFLQLRKSIAMKHTP